MRVKNTIILEKDAHIKEQVRVKIYSCLVIYILEEFLIKKISARVRKKR